MKNSVTTPKLYLLAGVPGQAMRLKWILCGTIAGGFFFFLFSLFDHLLPPTSAYSRYRVLTGLSYLALLFIAGVWGYAIFKKKLPNVAIGARAVLGFLVSKIILGIGLFLCAAPIFYALAIHSETSLKEILWANWGYLIGLPLFVAAIIFQRGLSHWIDRTFFHETLINEDILIALCEELRGERNLSQAVRLLLLQLDNYLQPQQTYILFRRSNLNHFILHHSPAGISQNFQIPEDLQLRRLFGRKQRILTFPLPEEVEVTDEENEWLKLLEAQLLIPMISTNNRITGLLALGAKKSEEAYTSTEQELLLEIARQLALICDRVINQEKTAKEAKLRLELLAKLETEQKSQMLREAELANQKQLALQFEEESTHPGAST